MKYGFIGCGNMGGAIAKALSRATKEIMVSDRSGKAEAFAEELGIVYSDAETIAARCDRIFIAVKPHMVQEVLSPLQKVLGKRKPLLITMAAGMEIAKLEQLAGTELPVIRMIDAASALSGSGPAFMYMFVEALADGAVACGLPRAKAVEYAAMTMAGSAEMLLATRQHPGALKDAVCSPGGSTIVGVQTLENHGFRGAAMDCVIDTYKKNKELGK